MKSVTIVIPNFNGFDALKLCIESIRKYTDYPHKIVVYDDCSTNKGDVIYLTECMKKGWIYHCFNSQSRRGHGGGLNTLLNHFCGTDLVMILDNDIQILKSGWLYEMVDQVDDDTLLVSGLEHKHKEDIPWFQSWFMMLNMRLYQPINWLAGNDGDKFLPTGARLYIANRESRYKIKPVPDSVKKKFYHFIHFSCYSTEHPTNDERVKPYRIAQAKRAREELRRLRGGG